MDESNADQAHHHAPNTVTDALDILHGLGYTADFELDGDVLHSARGDASCPVHEAVVEHLFRFEGPSDPGDEMIVFALHSPSTGTRGTFATAFGHSADPELYHHLSDLRHRFGVAE